MTYSTRPPVNPRFASPPDELDGLLRRFYRAQLPQPWPAPPRLESEQQTTEAPRKLAVARLFRGATRVAVAAAVAFLVIGYLALQGWFPDPRPTSAKPQLQRDQFARKLKIEESKPANNPDARLIVVEDLGARK
jgi:hypothetical protein